MSSAPRAAYIYKVEQRDSIEGSDEFFDAAWAIHHIMMCAGFGDASKVPVDTDHDLGVGWEIRNSTASPGEDSIPKSGRCFLAAKRASLQEVLMEEGAVAIDEDEDEWGPILAAVSGDIQRDYQCSCAGSTYEKILQMVDAVLQVTNGSIPSLRCLALLPTRFDIIFASLYKSLVVLENILQKCQCAFCAVLAAWEHEIVPRSPHAWCYRQRVCVRSGSGEPRARGRVLLPLMPAA